jgi:ATP-dependent Clp protease ATP-binding subunit ClpB
VFNTLLQILDDGRLTDAQGRTVDFKNTVIIMTSNIGSHHLLEGASADGELSEEARDAVLGELRTHFRPEFLNRIDDSILFKPLTEHELSEIVELLAQDLRKRLEDRNVNLRISDKARLFIARKGYDPVYGARPLKRYLQRELETRIGRSLIRGEVGAGSTIVVDALDDALVVSQENLEMAAVA